MFCRHLRLHYSVQLPQMGGVCSTNAFFSSASAAAPNAGVPEAAEREKRIARMADHILEQNREREKRRAEGIMHDEEILDGRIVKFNYVSEFVEQRQDVSFHKRMRRAMVVIALLGAAAFAWVKWDLVRKRRKKMFERQIKSKLMRQNVLQQKRQLTTN
ncbi:hypothetical protein GPALN_014692 [Globodera pallida]|uniref:Transmembrane protein n=1 Tax=Globodera pallida TaxID=36090 RepID=A0A183C5Z0_GLOPA|nr:hypothetical protein GPALN_014692 [Globodera pallida]